MRENTSGIGRMMTVGCLLVFLRGTAVAQKSQSDVSDDSEALAKAPQNPLASMISLPLQTNWNDGVGQHDSRSTSCFPKMAEVESNEPDAKNYLSDRNNDLPADRRGG